MSGSLRIRIFAFFLLALATAQGQSNSVMGNWTNPTGSTIQIYRCGAVVCARLIAISKDEPYKTDGQNPNPALRNRPLCDLQIGMDFHLASPGRAVDGQLYDPKSGKTYMGSMTLDGDKLKLRGYVGIPLFGRTETWTRALEDIATCIP